MFCMTLLVSIAAQIGLMMSNSLNLSFAFMILLGLTWPGKRVTGITYFLEFIPAQYQKFYIVALALLDYPSIALISFCYQYISRDWYPQQLCGVLLTTFSLVFCMTFLPKSPKFLFMKGRYREAKIIITDMRRFNGSTNHDKDIHFIEEQQYHAHESRDEEQSSFLEPHLNESQVSAKSVFAESNFKWNVLRMTIMWCSVSFATYLLHF